MKALRAHPIGCVSLYILLFTNRGPVHQSIPISKFVKVPKDQQYTVTQKTWDKNGWIFFGQKVKMSKDVTIPLKNDIFVESVPITKDSRHWKNEVSFAEFVEKPTSRCGANYDFERYIWTGQ